MIVKIQILMDDGKTLVLEHYGHAFSAFGQEFPPDSPLVAVSAADHATAGKKLYGWCYLPVPPPRDPADVAEFRRVLAEYFG